MNDLAAARAQLEQAIDRLEQALTARGDPGALAKALAEAREDSQRLRQAADSVNGRLDAAIGRLKAALETGAGH